MHPLRLFVFEQVTKGKSATYLFTPATGREGVEPAGEQLGMFGDHDKPFRVFRKTSSDEHNVA